MGRKKGTKVADYRTFGGRRIVYDPNYPCIYCGLPVGAASMGGTVVCPSCDCGSHRDGTKWTFEETTQFMANAKKWYQEREVVSSN